MPQTVKVEKNIALIAIIAISALYGCNPSKEKDGEAFEITAEIKGVEENTPIYLQKVKDGELESIDSAFIEDGKVTFEGSLERPEMLYMRIGDSRKMINVFAENSNISVTVQVDSLDKAVVKGSGVHDDLMAFKKHLEPIDEKAKKLSDAYRMAAMQKDEEMMKDILDEYEGLRQEQKSAIVAFVGEKSDAFIAPYIIRRYLAYEMEYPELDSLLTQLGPNVHNSEDYKYLSERVATLKKVAVGQPAVDFALPDTTGNPIAISSFKGKYLLIDFWASWCGPCRKENPNVVKLYNDYKDKGFEIIGVSFDEKRENWIKAIKDDKLTWPHVSDLKGWQCEAGKLYAVSAIPATVLLDKDGIIIAKNLRGDALREKLEELYAAEGQN